MDWRTCYKRPEMGVPFRLGYHSSRRRVQHGAQRANSNEQKRQEVKFMLLEAIAIIGGVLIGIAVLFGLAAVLEKFNVIIDLLEIVLGLQEDEI